MIAQTRMDHTSNVYGEIFYCSQQNITILWHKFIPEVTNGLDPKSTEKENVNVWMVMALMIGIVGLLGSPEMGK